MKHEIVEYIPRELQSDTVYVSMIHTTAVHSCFCGCGGRVVTPLSPAKWKLTFDGDSISLYPSIGNWNLDCKSHYWIRNGEVVWAERWSDDRIEAGRRREKQVKDEYYRKRRDDVSEPETGKRIGKQPISLWSKLKRWFR